MNEKVETKEMDGRARARQSTDPDRQQQKR
jgi:hypothetical protein